jgi:hypothetical protein
VNKAPDALTARRMAFIRYLLESAIAESGKPEPTCSAGLLGMHDSVELFLQLASEHLDVGRKRIEFMEYFDLIALALGRELSQKERMRRLNNARVGLKHSGIHPSSREIEGFRVTCQHFFEDNVPLVFGTSLDGLALIEFVEPEPVRQQLQDAHAHLLNRELANSLAKAAIAFARLVEVRREVSELQNADSPDEDRVGLMLSMPMH